MPHSPLLCDAVIVIEAHTSGVWEPLTQRCRIAVPGVVVEESRYFRDAASGQRKKILLKKAVAEGTVERFDASAEEVDDTKLALDRVTVDGLHAGELEALALLHLRDLTHWFCTAEEVATRALCHLGLHDRGVSLEQVLQECGLMKPLLPHFTERVFQQWRTRGVTEWIQRQGRPTR